MDFLITAFIYWIVNLSCPDKPAPQKTKDRGEFGYFIFSEERGCNQSDNDPFINSEYDSGPDW